MEIENPAFDYDNLGETYSKIRQTDPRIANYVLDALADAKTIINIGAGSGSYEPENKYVVAVEPSVTMRKQRLANQKVPAIDAKADSLPFDDNSFDAAMAMVTIHHWPDIDKGLREIRRVTKNQILVMTFDPDALDKFWNADYFPELIEVEKARYPKIQDILDALGGKSEVIEIPIPLDCRDGFQEAFYGRPEAFLNPEVRLNQSAWGFLRDGLEEESVNRLKADLDSGKWDEKFGKYRSEPFATFALRLIVSHPQS
ncbi:class I SAM-dependent methyltransferase [Flavobacterium sp.]|uniref:class I SAM-dependent methyltransferase n=1 Tax=Flavobacterium sp. TaxID=239 RepID=UPI0012093330|nr:class I SAM-dependent methyltransferase [Flavobacterium sp.]RZJ70392.1 MAG: SAM-dependent methyltransferase [Flavobacterium sp.]